MKQTALENPMLLNQLARTLEEFSNMFDLQRVVLVRTSRTASSNFEIVAANGEVSKFEENDYLAAFPSSITPTLEVIRKVPANQNFRLTVYGDHAFAYTAYCLKRDVMRAAWFRKVTIAPIQALESLCREHHIQSLNEELAHSRSEAHLARQSTAALLASFSETAGLPSFEVTLKYLLELFGLEHGSIWELHDNAYFSLEAVVNCPITSYRSNCFPKNRGLVSRALKTHSPKIQKTNIGSVPPDDLQNLNMFSFYEGRAIYLVRLGPDDNPYGVACLVGNTAKDVSETNPIFEVFEQFLALELKSRRRSLTTELFAGIQSLFQHDALDVPGICQRISGQLLSIVGCEAVTIVLRKDLSPEAGTMNVISSVIADDSLASQDFKNFKRGKRFSYEVDDTSITGNIVLTRKPFLSNTVSFENNNSRIYRESENSGNDSWLGVPIVTSTNDCIGVLRCKGRTAEIQGVRMPYIFDSIDQQILSSAAAIVAPLLQHKHAAEELRLVNERLERADRIKAHEMRGPLQVITSQASFVLKNLHDSGVTSKPRRLETIIRNVDLCATLLTSTVLPKASQFKAQCEVVNIKKMLISLTEVVRLQIDSRAPSQVVEDQETGEFKMITQPFMVVDDVVGAAPQTVAHRDLLQRAFYNVVSNAVKYAKWTQKGRLRIEIRLGPMDNWVNITFTDNGIGIKEDEKDKIFDLYFRGEDARKRPGEGIGLQLAKAIIELHGGTLTLTQPMNPTVFEITLPLLQVQPI